MLMRKREVRSEMPNKNKRYLLRKLGNRESVELSRSEIYRIVEHESGSVDVIVQQLLLTELKKRKDELAGVIDFNYMYMHQVLTDNELTTTELAYLLTVLFGGNKDERVYR